MAADETLWPPLRQAVANRPDDVALLAAMEEEHAVIAKFIEAIDLTLADRESSPDRLAELTRHLKHEEAETVPLIQATLDIEHWLQFGAAHDWIGGTDYTPRSFPWLVDGADDATVAALIVP